MRLGLSVVVPCYNEEERIDAFFQDWLTFSHKNEARLRAEFEHLELVFVNDGFTDQTRPKIERAIPDLLAKSPASLLAYVNLYSLEVNEGKGAAVRRGLQESKGDWVLICDADLSTPLVEIFKFKDANVDLAFGSRGLKASNITQSQSGLRPLLGRIFNFWMRAFTGLPFSDTQCGFKLLKGDLARNIGPRIRENRFAFDVEMLLLAAGESAVLREIPVEWAHREPSRVSPLKDGLRMARKVIEFSWSLPRYKVS